MNSCERGCDRGRNGALAGGGWEQLEGKVNKERRAERS